jgi:ligand-binding sensor protein
MNSERETILTLKDVDILDEKYEDVLVNVNIVDTERTKAGNNSR